MTSPVVIGDHAYLYTRANRFTCIHLEDGAEGWTSPPPGDEYWSLVAQGERILALSNTGILRLVRATPESYEVVGEVPISDDETWAHLVAADDQLFVRELHAMAVYAWK